MRANELHLGSGGETLEDTAKILSTYGDGFMLRTDKDEKLDHKVDPIAGKKPRTSIPSNSGRIKPGHQPT